MATKDESDTGVLERQKEKLSEPPMYKVVMHNDDYTPFEFVISVLVDIFRMSEEKATNIAVQIHHQGKGICGVFAKDIAEFKQQKVMDRARAEEHPLQCTIESEGPAPGRGPGMRR